MKILLTGTNGFLGQHLVALLLQKTAHYITATGKGINRLAFLTDERLQYHSLDITDAVAVNSFFKQEEPDIIIHAAAITQVDYCEKNKTICWNTNVTATRFLIDAAKNCNARFIYVSTDFVFDGEKGNYAETDNTGPVNYYGSSKLTAEHAVLESGLDNTIVRTCLVYGNLLNGNRSNIISWVKKSLEQQQKIKVVNDQYRTPTYINDLAMGIMLVLEKEATGIFHISGKEILTPFDMATATADFLSLDKSLIEKTDASSFIEPAKRPAKTGFVITKAEKELGFGPVSFAEGLTRMFA